MFEIRDEQYAALRRQVFTEKLLKIFEHSDKSAFYDPASQKILIQDCQGHTSSLGFDKYGFFGSMTSPLGRTWQLDNDSEGKLLGLLTPAGLRLGFDYNEDGDMARITRNHQPLVYLDYETKGFPRTITYADNTQTQISYNKLLKITALTDRQGQSETFDYDADGDLIGIRDGNGNHTHFDYSVWNRPDRVRYADGSTESYHYTPDGLLQRLVSGTDSVANIVSYNEAGQPTEIRYSEENVLYFKYDQAGRIIEARNVETTVKYVYDAKGRVIQEDQGGQVVQHHYDDLGLFIGLTYPSGDRVEFTYDADQRLSTVKDWQGGIHRFTYLERERGVKQFHPNGLVSQIQQSEMGLTTKIEVSERGASQPLFGFRYQYDDEDRVKVFEDSQFGRREYDYDAKSQVLAVKSKNARQTETFAYDPAGNRVRCNREEAQFNSLNQLTQQGATRCRYDGRGNLTEMFAQGVVWRYTFNRQNQLIRAESTAGTVVTFGYDALGRRLWKRCGTKEVRYFWSGEDLLGEETYQEGQRVSTQDYLYIPQAYKLLATRINQEVYEYHTDHLGTPRRLTDKLGKVVWAADYSAFGVTSITVQKVANQIRFLGQYFDVETGWHYNRFRYYSPGLGRYVSRDPITYLAGLNFYVYVGNNPVNAADPLGLLWIGPSPFWPIPVTMATWNIAKATVSCVNELLDIKDFCWKCAKKGFFEGLVFGFLAIVAVLALPEFGLLLAGIAVIGLINMCQSVENMTDEQKSEFWGNVGGGMVVLGMVMVGMVVTSFLAKPVFRVTQSGVTRLGRATPKNIPQNIPRGFKNPQQFEQAMTELQQSLKAEGITDAKVGVKGSAVTGQSSKGGPFRTEATNGMKPSDIDVFVESNQLSKVRGSTTNPNFVHPDKMLNKYPELKTWSEKWTKELGREITPAGQKGSHLGDKIYYNGGY